MTFNMTNSSQTCFEDKLLILKQKFKDIFNAQI